jgi:Mg2+-importing ATPase
MGQLPSDHGEQPAAGALHAPFWIGDPEEALRRLDTSVQGLTSEQALDRLRRYGPNAAVVSLRHGVLMKLAKRLTEPLVAILLIAAAISGVMGDWQSLAIISAIVLMSVVLDIVQEHQAEEAVSALRASVAVQATVRRDGSAVQLPVRDIVPGDIVEMRAGQLVPADGVVLASRNALADESALTGEPFAAEKRRGPSGASAPADAYDALFAGTTIVAGEAVMLVLATGAQTYLGAISRSLQAQLPPTAFQRGVHDLGMLILRLTGFLVLFVLLTQLLRNGLSFESFLFAIALAVGLTPELLPMVMTVTLARGAVRMAAAKVVVKRLSAINDLGTMDVLCTDKTGTLTQARVVHVGSFGVNGGDSAAASDLVRLNSRLGTGMRTNLDDAVLANAPSGSDGVTLVAELPFDFERRRAAIMIARGPDKELIVKGAPETLLSLCASYLAPDAAVQPLDNNMRAALLALFEAKGADGLRLLGVARKAMPPDAAMVRPSDESNLVFVGCAAFLDPPKASASEAVARLAAAGVRVKIISGDAGPVVAHLVNTLKLSTRGMMTGDEIAALSDAALAVRVSKVDLFVRVAPEQKARIVMALKRARHTVGFLGDGINDAPAIRVADVGLSVEGGTDVAREAAAIVLLATDLNVLAQGVAEGRRTYANIIKYVRMGTSSNFGNMLSMALASLFLPFLPLAPVQILVNNILYDLSEIGIPFDNADPWDLAKPHGWDMRAVLRFTLVMGPLSSIFDGATFALLLGWFHTQAAEFQTAWFVESILSQILVIFVIRTSARFWRSRPHPVLVATSLGALAVALGLALSPIGRAIGFVALPLPLLGAIGVLAGLYLAAAEALKRVALQPRDLRGRPR